MVIRGVFDMLHREIRGLHEAAYLLAFFTLGSQLMALVRDRLLAYTFGTGEVLDVFYAAFRVPDTMYALLASVVSLFVLIPFLESAVRKGTSEVRTFLSHMFSFFSVALIVIAGVLWISAESVVGLLYGGFSSSMQADLVIMIRVLLIQPLLLGVSNLFAAYVQVKGRFLLYASAPILYNLGIIAGVLVLYPLLGIAGLAWGVVLGALLHVGVQVPYIMRERVLPRLCMPDWKQVFAVVRVSLPRALTLSAQQIVLMVLVSLAAFFAVGSVSAFSFAWNLQAVPLAIIGASYSVAAFPKLAKLFGTGDRVAYRDLIVTAARQIIFWALPATVLFIVLRAQFVRTVLGSGAFDWDATMLTSALLAVLVASLVGQSLVVLLVRGCYAAGQTLVPLVLNLGSSLLTVALAYLLVQLAKADALSMAAFESLMRVQGVPGTEVLLLALAFSIGSFLNVLFLLAYFELAHGGIVRGILRTTVVSIVASLAAGFAAYGGLNVLDNIVSLDTVSGVFMQGVGAAFLGVVAWLLALTALGSQDLAAAWAALHARVTGRRMQDARGSIES